MLLNRIGMKLQMFLLAGFMPCWATAAVDTSEYGAWNDILTRDQAVGRFEWLERCYKGLLVETWDQLFDPAALIPEDEKVEYLRQAWLYEGGIVKRYPNYLTFGDNDHRNPKAWYAGTQREATCKTIPVDYRIIGLMTSFDMKNYCPIQSQDTEYEWIGKVEFGTYANVSGENVYTHFSGRIIKATAGAEYDIKLTPGFRSDEFLETWHLWVDWNGDGDFTDTGEFLFEATSKSTVTKKITVPADAAPGFTKMRVTMDAFGGQSDPCKDTQFGEVEDYTLLIK